jgi:hypothetical protein
VLDGGAVETVLHHADPAHVKARGEGLEEGEPRRPATRQPQLAGAHRLQTHEARVLEVSVGRRRQSGVVEDDATVEVAELGSPAVDRSF